MEYDAERAMPAPAQVVFDTVADMDLLSEWLPGSLHVTDAGENLVHADGSTAGRPLDAEGVFGADREQLRVEWGSGARATTPAGSRCTTARTGRVR